MSVLSSIARTFAFAMASITAALPSLAAEAPPLPLPKDGSCPSRYYSSGGYCVPQSDARHAIPKIGACPSGYYSSGKYCVANREGAAAVEKRGACPSGYYSSGNYCVKNRR